MGINPVQFQRGLPMAQFMQRALVKPVDEKGLTAPTFGGPERREFSRLDADAARSIRLKPECARLAAAWLSQQDECTQFSPSGKRSGVRPMFCAATCGRARNVFAGDGRSGLVRCHQTASIPNTRAAFTSRLS